MRCRLPELCRTAGGWRKRRRGRNAALTRPRARVAPKLGRVRVRPPDSMPVTLRRLCSDMYRLPRCGHGAPMHRSAVTNRSNRELGAEMAAVTTTGATVVGHRTVLRARPAARVASLAEEAAAVAVAVAAAAAAAAARRLRGRSWWRARRPSRKTWLASGRRSAYWPRVWCRRSRR